MASSRLVFFFFFQAEDGIRDLTVTGVQTCALPIWRYPQLCQYSGRQIPWRRGLASLPRQDRRLLQICLVREVKTPLAALQTRNAQGLWGGGGRITEQCSSLQTRTPSSLPPMANVTDIHFLRVFPGTKSRRLFTGI